MTRIPLQSILEACDAGLFPADIAASTGASLSRVYTALREHRPERARKPRPTTSSRPEQVRGMVKVAKMKPARVAAVLGVTRQYVYKCLQPE